MAPSSSTGDQGGQSKPSEPDIVLWLFILVGALVIEVFLIRSGWSAFVPTPQPDAESWLLGGCFLVALISVALAGFIHESRGDTQKGLFRPVYGLPTWDPSSSWGTNLTAAGGILGIILAQNVIPKTDTHYFTTNQYILLYFLFGGLILFGPFLYNCFTTTVPDPTTQEPTRCGYGLTYLLATLLTTWAVCGQLMLSWFIVAEFEFLPAATLVTINVLHIFLVTAVPLLAIYVVTTVPGVMEAQHLAKPRVFYLVPGKEPAVVAAPPRRWALL